MTPIAALVPLLLLTVWGLGFTMGGSSVRIVRSTVAMILKFRVQNLGFVERVLVACTKNENGGSRKQQGGGELHEQNVESELEVQ